MRHLAFGFLVFFLKMCISCVYLVIQRFCVVKGIQWIIIEITKTPVPLGKKAVWPSQQSACVGSGTTINAGFHPLGSQRKRHTHWSTNFYITHKVINSFLERKSIPLRLRFVPIILNRNKGENTWQPAHLLSCCSLFYDQLFFLL